MKTVPHIKRKIGRYTVMQRKKDGMFCVNDFLRVWNKANPKEKVGGFKHFLCLEDTRIFMRLLQKQIGEDVKLVDENLVRDGGTWFDPRLFIEFLNWVSPTFKVDAVNAVYESYLDIRKDVAENYRELSSVANKLEGFDSSMDYKTIGDNLNWIVFNYIGNKPRERANSEQLKELHLLENNLIFCIENGIITDFEQLKKCMRFLYNKKYKKDE